jgi:hypothetical protein
MLQHAGGVVGMQVLGPELQDLGPLDAVRRDPAKLAKAAVDEVRALAEVDLVIGKAGDVVSRGQAGLALAEGRLYPLAVGDVLRHGDEV